MDGWVSLDAAVANLAARCMTSDVELDESERPG
jgi:hypothetical protein